VHKSFVLTLTGKERVGVVEEATAALLELGANIETSKMTRLGGEFAMLMLVSVPERSVDALASIVERLAKTGYQVTATTTEPLQDSASGLRVPYQVIVQGADHEGIVHEIAANLAHFGINIETMDTFVSPAAVSGMPLFSMIATVEVPCDLEEGAWTEKLRKAATDTNVDITITAL